MLFPTFMPAIRPSQRICSPTSVTANTSGAYATELRYYAYGGVRYNPGNQITTYRYTGQRWDSGTSLYCYGARWYDPAIGRFLAADTIVPEPGNPQSLNRYSYVLNNPLKFTDPTGHSNCLECVGGGAGGAYVPALSWQNGQAGLLTKETVIKVAAALTAAYATISVTTKVVEPARSQTGIAAQGGQFVDVIPFAKPNTQGNRGAERWDREGGQNFPKNPKEDRPTPPPFGDPRQKRLGQEPLQLPPVEDVLKSLDPKQIGWGRFVLAKMGELIDAILGNIPQ